MKTIIAFFVLSLSLSAFAQWTHYGEEVPQGPDCNTYHYWEVAGCEEVTAQRNAEAAFEFKLKMAKKHLMESDVDYMDMLSSFKGCEDVNVKSKKLSKMNQAELCRRQLTDRLEKSGYFKELEANFKG